MMKKWYMAALLVCSIGAAHAADEDAVLQIGVYNNIELAEQQAARAALYGVPARVENNKDAAGYVRYRVRTDVLPRGKADEYAAKLKKQQMEVLLLEHRTGSAAPRNDKPAAASETKAPAIPVTPRQSEPKAAPKATPQTMRKQAAAPAVHTGKSVPAAAGTVGKTPAKTAAPALKTPVKPAAPGSLKTAKPVKTAPAKPAPKKVPPTPAVPSKPSAK